MSVTLNEESQSQWIANNCEHLRYEYDLSPSDLVIDIGAHTGEFSQAIFDKYACRVIAIEPTGYIEGFSDGQIIMQAASDHEGFESFGGLSLYTSIYEPHAHKFPCFDINKLLEQHSEVALLKINIEGGEYKLLNHVIDAGLHTRIKNLQVQFHMIDGEPYEDWYERDPDGTGKDSSLDLLLCLLLGELGARVRQALQRLPKAEESALIEVACANGLQRSELVCHMTRQQGSGVGRSKHYGYEYAISYDLMLCEYCGNLMPSGVCPAKVLMIKDRLLNA